MQLTSKDKSLILFIASGIIVIWALFSIISNLFYATTFRVADVNKIIIKDNQNKWFNVSRPLEVDDFKNRLIIVHFWTYGCSNCAYGINEIKKLEEEFGDRLTVIGVHSAKFKDEKDYNAIKKAITRFDINHPVVTDYNLDIWKNFKINEWPTYLLIDPNGRLIKKYNSVDLEKMIKKTKKMLSKYKFQISKDKMPTILEKDNNIAHILRFPTKIKYIENFSYKDNKSSVLVISNSSQNNLIISSLSGKIILKVGSGKRGLKDGSLEDASFNSPQGVLYDGNLLYIADTGNNSIRAVDFNQNLVKTIIGDGANGYILEDANSSSQVSLSLPTDLEFFPDKNHILISNSGSNQILSYSLLDQLVYPFIGNGDISFKAGKFSDNSVGQISDMTVYNNKLYFIDSYNSVLAVSNSEGEVEVLLDEKNENNSLIQNPKSLYVDDTGIYITNTIANNIVKYDFNSNKVKNFIGSSRGEDVGTKTKFDEPQGITAAFDKLYVSDTNNNRVLIVSRNGTYSELLDIIPPLKLTKEGFLEYLPNVEQISPVNLASNNEILVGIILNRGWKINEQGPSFINLLEITDSKKANLIASYDWNAVLAKQFRLPKMKEGQDYILQGKIYYCKTAKNSLCYIKNYEQKISVNEKNNIKQFNIELGDIAPNI